MLRPTLRSLRKRLRSSTSNSRNLHRVCVVGSGPAGFYATEELLKTKIDVRVDILERFPTPHGLIRYGVAPDHPEVKLVSKKFDEIAHDKRVRFFGNVTVGVDVHFDELKHYYDAIVLAYGAEEDRALGISGEDSKQIHSAKYARVHRLCANLIPIF